MALLDVIYTTIRDYPYNENWEKKVFNASSQDIRDTTELLKSEGFEVTIKNEDGNETESTFSIRRPLNQPAPSVNGTYLPLLRSGNDVVKDMITNKISAKPSESEWCIELPELGSFRPWDICKSLEQEGFKATYILPEDEEYNQYQPDLMGPRILIKRSSATPKASSTYCSFLKPPPKPITARDMPENIQNFLKTAHDKELVLGSLNSGELIFQLLAKLNGYAIRVQEKSRQRTYIIPYLYNQKGDPFQDEPIQLYSGERLLSKGFYDDFEQVIEQFSCQFEHFKATVEQFQQMPQNRPVEMSIEPSKFHHKR